MPTGRPNTQAHRGVVYLSLLLGVAVLGLGLMATATLWTQSRHREQEVELVHIGTTVRQALRRYYLASPGARRLPKSLDQLLLDTRGPVPRRFLRQLPRDPFTGQDFVLLRDPQGGIIGLHSPSTRSPIRRQGWPEAAGSLNPQATSYQEWLFLVDLQSGSRLGRRPRPPKPGGGQAPDDGPEAAIAALAASKALGATSAPSPVDSAASAAAAASAP